MAPDIRERETSRQMRYRHLGASGLEISEIGLDATPGTPPETYYSTASYFNVQTEV